MGKEWNLPEKDRIRLRELACRQAEYAALPVMEARKRLWFDLNDGVADARPPVVVETWTFDGDFLPPEAFGCESDLGKRIERQMLRNVRNHELIDDDKVMPDAYRIWWHVEIDEFGVPIRFERPEGIQGVNIGHRIIHPITDLERDFERLKPATCRVDRARTAEWKAFLEDVLGDALPVEIQGEACGNNMLTQSVIHLMGMEAFFMAMVVAPDALHRLMAYLRDNALRVMRWAESEELLTLNNGNQDSFGSSFNFTRKLPAREMNGGPVQLRDRWGAANSQETVGVSPQLFHEFCAPYYRDVCEPLGLVYWGCCEPPDVFWEDLKDLPHLKKVSIPKWADQQFMGEALQGTGVVASRKPDPNLLGVDAVLNEERWAAHVGETLDAMQGVGLEFIVRDVYTVHGNLEKPRRAVEIARREIDKRRGGAS